MRGELDAVCGGKLSPTHFTGKDTKATRGRSRLCLPQGCRLALLRGGQYCGQRTLGLQGKERIRLNQPAWGLEVWGMGSTLSCHCLVLIWKESEVTERTRLSMGNRAWGRYVVH